MRLVYVPSEDNPADAPSRGVKRSAFRKRRVVGPCRLAKFRCDDKELREGFVKKIVEHDRRRCPSCGVLPESHPKHVAKTLRGTGLFCRTRGKLNFAHRDGRWIEYYDDKLRSSAQFFRDALPEHGLSFETLFN